LNSKFKIQDLKSAGAGLFSHGLTRIWGGEAASNSVNQLFNHSIIRFLRPFFLKISRSHT
jgi:hypothetical protein